MLRFWKSRFVALKMDDVWMDGGMSRFVFVVCYFFRKIVRVGNMCRVFMEIIAG
jgi:hypothetical protein